jgi:hypothetical protein
MVMLSRDAVQVNQLAAESPAIQHEVGRVPRPTLARETPHALGLPIMKPRDSIASEVNASTCLLLPLTSRSRSYFLGASHRHKCHVESCPVRILESSNHC